MKTNIFATLGLLSILTSCNIDNVPLSSKKSHTYPITYTEEVDSLITENLQAITTYARMSSFYRKKLNKEELIQVYWKNPAPFNTFIGFTIGSEHYTIYTEPTHHPGQTLLIKREGNYSAHTTTGKKVKSVEFMDKGANGTLDLQFSNGDDYLTPIQEQYEDIIKNIITYINTEAEKNKNQNQTKDTYLNSDSLLSKQ